MHNLVDPKCNIILDSEQNEDTVHVILFIYILLISDNQSTILDTVFCLYKNIVI